MTKKLIFPILILIVSLFGNSFLAHAQSEKEDERTAIAIEIDSINYFFQHINIQSTENGLTFVWLIDYSKFHNLKNQNYSISLKYASKKNARKDNWTIIENINIQDCKYELLGLEGGQEYQYQLGLSNNAQEYWTTIEKETPIKQKSNLFRIFVLLGSLGLFIYGMKIMSEGVQRAAGEKFRHLLDSITSNKFKAVLAGLGITALIQSASVTTVMTVSFANAGLMSLSQAVGIMMGASIGHTISGWMISFFGFSIDIGAYAVILIAFAVPMLFFRKPSIKALGSVIIGFSLIFIGLAFLQSSIPNIDSDSDIVQFFINLNAGSPILSVLLFAVFGVLITVTVQSSAASLALTMTLVASGVLSFELAAAMLLGESLGTTITAELAATVGNIHAKRAARINTLFNFLGVVWALLLLPVLLYGIELLMVNTGIGSPTNNPKQYANTGLSILFTGYNILNVLIFIWFIPFLVKLTEMMIKSKGEQDEEFRLDFINSGHVPTPDLSLLSAKKEIAKFGKITSRMSEFTRQLLNEENKKQQKKLIERLAKYEEITDRVEVEIGSFLNNIAEGGGDVELTARIRGMNSILNDLERIGDIFYRIGKDIERKNEKNIKFKSNQQEGIIEMLDLIDESFKIMCENLNKNRAEVDISSAVEIERKIIEKRDEIRNNYLDMLSKTPELNIHRGIIYNNIIASLDRIGGHIINVSEGIIGKI